MISQIFLRCTWAQKLEVRSIEDLIMACCYIAAYFLNRLVRTCEALSLDDGIHYNGTGAMPYDESKQSIMRPNGTETDTKVLSLSGMTCGDCVGTVERALLRVAGVSRTRVSLILQQATVVMDSGHQTTMAALMHAVEDAGYDATAGPRSPVQLKELLSARQEIVGMRGTIAGIGRNAAVLFGLNFLVACIQRRKQTSNLGSGVVWILELIAVVVALEAVYIEGSWIHKSSWKAAKKGAVNMNTLISLSTSLGVLLSVVDVYQTVVLTSGNSYLQSACGLIMLVTVGKFVELLFKRSAAKHIGAMIKPMIEGRVAVLSPSGQASLEFLCPSID